MEAGRHVVLVTSQVCLSLPWSTVYEDWSAAPSWLPEWRTHSWIPCSTPLCWYPTKVHTASHSTLHTHAKGTHATILSKDPCAHTFVVHTALVIYYANTSGEGGEKKGGRAKGDNNSSAVLPSTHIHSDPLSKSLSLTRYSHSDKILTPHGCLYTKNIQ